MGQRTSLRGFVRANDKLLEAFGVFAGLSAVLAHFGDQTLGQLVSVTSFALALLLLWETLDYPPKNEREHVSPSCSLFKIGLVVMVIELGGYLARTSLLLALAHLKFLAIALVFVPLFVAANLVSELTGLSKRITARPKSRVYKALLFFCLGVFLMFLIALSEYVASLLRV